MIKVRDLLKKASRAAAIALAVFAALGLYIGMRGLPCGLAVGQTRTPQTALIPTPIQAASDHLTPSANEELLAHPSSNERSGYPGAVESQHASAPQEAVIAKAPERASDWNASLAAIRAAGTNDDPHRTAWRHVQALGRHARADLDGDDPGPVAVALEALLRDSTGETPFVRGALLLALAHAHPAPAGRILADEFLAKGPGDPRDELARAAWLATARSDGAGVDLGEFERHHSKTRRTVWPVTVRSATSDDMVDEVLAQLHPTILYGVGESAQSRAADDWAADGTLTRETIVLAHLAGAAQQPGPIRDKLFEWAVESDMSHACIWSLCLAARTDDGLALALRDLLSTMDLSSSEGALLAELLAGLARRGDLVFDTLTSQLIPLEADEDIGAYMAKLNAIFALGAMIESGESALVERAIDLLVEIALTPGRSDRLRRVSLVQIAVSAPELTGDVLEAILVSPESASMRRMAALLTRTEPAATRQRMRDALMNSFSDDLTDDVRESYIRALIALGGDDATAFLRNLSATESLSAKVREELDALLAN